MPEEKDEFGGVALAEPEKDEFGGEALDISPAAAAKLAVTIPQVVTGTTEKLFGLAAPGAEMARAQTQKDVAENAERYRRQLIAGGGPSAGMAFIPPGAQEVPGVAIRGGVEAANWAARNLRNLASEAVSGKPFEPEPIFGEPPEETERRRQYPLGAPGRPLYEPQAATPSDVQKWFSEASTPDQLLTLPLGATRTGAKILLGTMLPGVAEQIKQVASEEGSNESKMDRIRGLVVPAVIGLLATRPEGVKLAPGKLPPRVGTIDLPGPITGEELPGRPEGAPLPPQPPPVPTAPVPPRTAFPPGPAPTTPVPPRPPVTPAPAAPVSVAGTFSPETIKKFLTPHDEEAIGPLLENLKSGDATLASTEEGWKLGISIRTPEQLRLLKEAWDAAKTRSDKIRTLPLEERFKAFGKVNQSMFLREAYEAATGTGSAGSTLSKIPEYKPPFPETVTPGQAPPAEAPPAPAEEAAKPATIEETVIGGKTLADWEKVTDTGGLPKGAAARAALAKFLAVPNLPQRIIQALANKKRTREIHAPPMPIEEAQGAPVPETKPAVTPVTAVQAPAKETPAVQATPPKPLEGKGQKKFLIGEINKALADAPDAVVEPGRAGGKYESDEAQRERIKENTAVLERNKQKFGTVTIEVPGDGVFTVLNVKSALLELQEKAKSFPVSATREPAKKGTPSGKPTAPSSVGEGSPEDITSALDAFTSQETDPNKPALGYAYSDGKQTVATDGRHMVIIKGALAGGTAKNPKVTSTDGKFVPESVKAPNYQQVINTVRAESEPWFKGIDTARLFNLLKQAMGAMGEKDLSVQFWRNPDGSLGLKSGGGEVGSYEHNIKEGAKVVSAFNPQYVMDALHAARKMGSEQIDILGKDELSGVLFKGKGVEAIVMPMRLEGPPQTEVTKPPAPEGGIKPGEGVGPGAAASAEFTARENRRRLLADVVERIFGTRAGEIVDALSRKAAGEVVPKTMARSGESGNAMVRFAASSTAAPYIAHSHVIEVLGDHLNDVDFRDRLGAVLVEDRLRAIKQGLVKAGKTKEAADVNTLVGKEELPGIDLVKAAFPSASVRKVTLKFKDAETQVFEVTLPNGKHVLIDPLRKEIIFDRERIAKEHGIDPANIIGAKGKYRGSEDIGLPSTGLIELLKDFDQGTLSHEKFHALFDLLFTKEQKEAIIARFGTEEKAAEAWRRREGFSRDWQDKLQGFVTKIKSLAVGDPFAGLAGEPSNKTVSRGHYFANEADFQAALKDPEIAAAIERHKQTIQPEAERFHTEAEGQLAGPGINTGAFVNLLPIFEDSPAMVFRGATKGDYTRPFKRKSVFSRQAKGTAAKYETDYSTLAERMIRGNYEEFTKRQLYDQLVKDNLAVVLPPAAPRPTFEGKPGVKFQIKRQTLVTGGGAVSQYENLWVDPAIAPELRAAENLDGPIRNVALARFANVLNRIQLAGPTDAVWHTANMLSLIASSPGGKTLLSDVARQVPLVNVVDAVVRVSSEAKNILANDPETMRRVAELAEIGQIRADRPQTGPVSRFINLIDKAGRVVRDKMYENLSQRKNILGKPLIEPSEAGRREWVGQLGQYNPRLMGQIESFFKEAGLSPFIVAGRNFNRAALRRVTLSPGVRAADLTSAIQMRAVQGLGLLATLVAVPAAINYFTTGSPSGRKGVPFGAIDTGKDSADGHYIIIDPAQWIGLRRGMRMTGANALIEGLRRGELPSQIVRRAGTDIASALIHPWAGPVVQAGSILRTGYSTSGFKESKDPHDYWQNFLGALRNINPLLHGWFQRQGGLGIPSAASSLAGAAGIKGASPYTAGQEIYNLAQKWKMDSGSAKLQKEVERRLQEDFGPSDYKDLRSSLARGDMEQARQAYEVLLKTKTPADIVRTLEHPHPFTGSRSSEVKFRASLTDEERELYQKALEERRAIFRKFREMQSTYRE